LELFDKMEGVFEEALNHAREPESTMWLKELGHWTPMETDTYSEFVEEDEENDFFERVATRLEKLDAKLHTTSGCCSNALEQHPEQVRKTTQRGEK